MLGLTTLGIVHTAIGLVALACGVTALVKYREITPDTRSGQVYLWLTLAAAVTSLFIFQHGGFGKPHVLAIITLVALAVGIVAARTTLFGRVSRDVEAIAFSSTILFHLIPGVTETSTRLPAGAPLFASADDPALAKIAAVMGVVLVVGLILQIRWIRRSPATPA